MMLQLILHLVGDYILQSDWMAREKTRRHLPCLLHAAIYTIPFLILTRSPWALLLIGISHFVIDRWRLIRYINWLKNSMAPRGEMWPWSACTATGYPDAKSPWLSVWLMIIADNTLHLVCNYAALSWLT